jgi:hypothetical protein
MLRQKKKDEKSKNVDILKAKLCKGAWDYVWGKLRINKIKGKKLFFSFFWKKKRWIYHRNHKTMFLGAKEIMISK